MLTDQFQRPLKDLRISVTDRCNFRCSYCMPAEVFGQDYTFLEKSEILSFEEIHRLARIFVDLGVRKIRLTGGEPLLRADLEILVRMLSEIDGLADLALTTNAYLLEQNAHALRKAGLKRLTISLDTLKPERLKKLAGRHLDLERVLGGIEAAVACGFAPIKLNAVIQKNVNDDEILDLLRFARQHGHIMRFIEYMDVGTLNGWRLDDVVSAKEIIEIVAAEFPIVAAEKNYPGEVANRYRFLDGKGEFGIIASVTQPFCGGCTRVRLSADGRIYTCLFANTGFDIKSLLRANADDSRLRQAIRSLWAERHDRYSEERTSETRLSKQKKVEMYHIGG